MRKKQINSVTITAIPFQNKVSQEEGGIYYGLNQIGRNAIFCDRLELSKPSGLILGTPGKGKKFSITKEDAEKFIKEPPTTIQCK